MSRSKLVAIITGAISVFLAVAYLILVQLLDFRGEMLPAPQSQLTPSSIVAVAVLLDNSNPPTTAFDKSNQTIYRSSSADRND